MSDTSETADTALGRWQVSASTDPAFRKDMVVVFTLEPDALVVGRGGEPPVRIPYGTATCSTASSQWEAEIGTGAGTIRVTTGQASRTELLARGIATGREALGSELPITVTRQYRGQQTEAAAAMARDAEGMARQGYTPTSQSYSEGSWGCGAWFLAFLAVVLLVGLIALVYMAVNKPDGVLTVTYERRAAPAAPAAPAAASPSDRLRDLDKLRSEGLLTDEEYAAKRSEIISAL
jgi:hypothetical protein